MGDTLDVIGADYEDYYLTAAAFSRELFNPRGLLSVGPELGVAGRFGEGSSSSEVWGGIHLRPLTLRAGNWAKLSSGLTAGFSFVDKSLGEERKRAERHNGDAGFLFYLGPEISLSLPVDSRWEIVYRLHHRSGGDGTLGDFREAYNANTIGIRYLF